MDSGLIAIFDLSDVGQVGHFSREKVGQVEHFPREKVGQVGHFSSGKVGQVRHFEHFVNRNIGQFNTLTMKIRYVEANRSLYIEEVHFVIMRRTLYMLEVDDTF